MASGVSPAAQAVAAVKLQTETKKKPATVTPQQPLLVGTGAFGAYPPAVSETPCAHAHAHTCKHKRAHSPSRGWPQEASEPSSLQQGFFWGGTHCPVMLPWKATHADTGDGFLASLLAACAGVRRHVQSSTPALTQTQARVERNTSKHAPIDTTPWFPVGACLGRRQPTVRPRTRACTFVHACARAN